MGYALDHNLGEMVTVAFTPEMDTLALAEISQFRDRDGWHERFGFGGEGFPVDTETIRLMIDGANNLKLREMVRAQRREILQALAGREIDLPYDALAQADVEIAAAGMRATYLLGDKPFIERNTVFFDRPATQRRIIEPRMNIGGIIEEPIPIVEHKTRGETLIPLSQERWMELRTLAAEVREQVGNCVTEIFDAGGKRDYAESLKHGSLKMTTGGIRMRLR